MLTLARCVLSLLLVVKGASGLAADDPTTSTPVGRFAMEAFLLSVQEGVDLCSATYPALQSDLTVASAELRKRYAALLAESLQSEEFSSLLEAEAPQELVILNRQQSALRRQVNTTTTQEKCERTIREFKAASDELLYSTIYQLLSVTKRMIERESKGRR